MLYHDPAAKTHDRIGFTLTMAIALHVAIVLGVGFAMTVPKAPTTTRMDITLSHHASEKTIIDADFVAQTSQEASGSESSKAELSTDRLAPINSSLPQPVNVADQTPRSNAEPIDSLQVLTTGKESTFVMPLQDPEESETQDSLDGEAEYLLRQIEIASLQAKLAKELQIYARLPRIRRASSVATKAAEDAEYLYHWQQRIETIGNQHYPPQAREQQLSGDVQVLVAVNADGSLHDVQVLRSSGITVLDQAALRTVRLSAPFPPFSAALKKTTDRLEIVRTWQFRQDSFTRVD